jgi:outer membrane immunogenic protein
MRRLCFALLATTSIGLPSIACAADLGGPPPKSYASPALNWAGVYAGANIGGAWSSADGTITMGGASGSISGNGAGFLGGVQVGYNWQSGSFVAGLETDFQGSSGSGSADAAIGAITVTGTAKTPWFGTIRGRVGYANEGWLFYVTGGGLYGESTLDGVVSTTGPFSSSANYWTWTAGAGVETFLWDRWSAKIEYLYAGSPNTAPVPPGTTDLTGSANTNIVRVGLNYHF